MTGTFILGAVRTPVGKYGGALAAVRPDDLAAVAIQAAVERAGIEPGEVDEVILGCANQAGEDNRNVARMAVLLAGFPDSVPAITVNRLCASGLAAVNLAARAICAGEAEIIVAGGVESMTRAPYALPKNSRPYGPPGNVTAYDTTMGWRFPNPLMAERFPLETMGETAENLVGAASRGELPGGPLTRHDQDVFALESHTRAVNAMATGRFDDELVSVPIKDSHPLREVRLDEPPRFTLVEGRPRLATSLDQLAALRPVFREDGTVTAGNASGLSDGAAALVLVGARTIERLGLRPLARWVGACAVGVDPRTMGLGPVPASRRLLRRFGLNVAELDLVEVNEAFAAQALAVIRSLELDAARTNVNGGAIALGHPLGASGARILTTLLHELRRRGDQARYGLATLCVGVGQGEATLVERV